MMFLDASIVVAILGKEEDWQIQFDKLRAVGGTCYYTAIVRYEATLALSKLTAQAQRAKAGSASLVSAEAIFDDFMNTISATEIDITSQIGKRALLATRTYGKAVGHKAALNFGDCFSYAAARALGVGLLYKGDDFALTDLA
jgi:ribonuclease VapC